MAEEKSGIHIDADWKKQAQEEKRKLAEQEAAKAKSPATASGGGATAGAAATTRAVQGGQAGPRGQVPAPSFATLVQSIATQILFYLGDIAARGGEPVINLDMAKHHIDTLAILEQKTAGNLSDDEKRMLDTALYETRMRYVTVASQYT